MVFTQVNLTTIPYGTIETPLPEFVHNSPLSHSVSSHEVLPGLNLVFNKFLLMSRSEAADINKDHPILVIRT